MAHHPQTLAIYEQLMLWLEKATLGKSATPTLRIPRLSSNAASLVDMDLPITPPAPDMEFSLVVLRASDHAFYGARYVSDKIDTTIWYDPNWRSYLVIEAILREE
jgi:hypothetical protein